MPTLFKTARSDSHGQRSSFGEMVGGVRRAWSAKPADRTHRPLQDIDRWSDQVEVAFYEDVRPFRSN